MGRGRRPWRGRRARIEPVYPATQDLPSTVIWKVLSGMLEQLTAEVEEWFGADYLRERNFFTRRGRGW